MHEIQKLMNDGSLVSVDNAFRIIKNIENEAQLLKEQEKSLADKRKSLELMAEDAKYFIKQYLITNGLAEIEGTMIKYSLSKSNPKLIIDDEKLIPSDYKVDTITTTIRKDAIKDQLKMGDEIPGARLEESFALKVSLK